jgi:hypothetical protein
MWRGSLDSIEKSIPQDDYTLYYIKGNKNREGYDF